MLVYTILLSCIAVFFYKEGKSMKQMNSRFLLDFNKDPSVAELAANQLFLIAFCSAISAGFMFLAFIYRQIATTSNAKVLIALSFLIYGAGFMMGMYRCYKLKK
ncbi:hypothetical protein [Anaerotignum sp. MB30-C6]|uniref:hypothetical protein n=1 Tax=Anaerotignum sp. MB30-C6 TaxID=3070814 RepID=UPI0027DB7CDD|nr:hypothetical protein [Anaerotignum sp. MB30-C6]WMI80665.1 hypothetical protein RBQ60_12665 [Anaerotignum sp. MB30-C6]